MNDSSESRRSTQEIIRLLYEIRDNTKEHMLPAGTAQMLMIGAVSTHNLYLMTNAHSGEVRIEVQGAGIRIAIVVDGGVILWSTFVHFHPDDILAMNAKGQWR